LGASPGILLNTDDLKKEIKSSWRMLFTTHNKSTKKDIANYDKIRPLEWATGDSGGSQKFHHLGRNGLSAKIVRRYLRPLDARILRRYTEFTVFENRIRQLVYYMDTQKPQGFRQLWRDKRDTLNYYTFWGVIIFGGLSVFLALFSLAVGIAQTVASFRALKGGPSPVSPSG
jgi:hypothetical protein